jgi:hypothetical protein
MKYLVLSMVSMVIFGAASSGWALSSGHRLGTSVSVEDAQSLRGGCLTAESYTCPAKGGCAVNTVVRFATNGTDGDPAGIKYCGGTVSCGMYYQSQGGCCSGTCNP